MKGLGMHIFHSRLNNDFEQIREKILKENMTSNLEEYNALIQRDDLTNNFENKIYNFMGKEVGKVIKRFRKNMYNRKEILETHISHIIPNLVYVFNVSKLMHNPNETQIDIATVFLRHL